MRRQSREISGHDRYRYAEVLLLLGTCTNFILVSPTVRGPGSVVLVVGLLQLKTNLKYENTIVHLPMVPV